LSKPSPVDWQASIYPNPASDQVTISLNEFEEGAATIRILNTLGKVVWMQDLDDISESYQLNIDLNDSFTPGLYFIVIMHDGTVHTRQVVIQK
jgi:hypothetical protein